MAIRRSTYAKTISGLLRSAVELFRAFPLWLPADDAGVRPVVAYDVILDIRAVDGVRAGRVEEVRHYSPPD